jgi:predicted DNA-binding transcriptional regulator
MCNQSFWKHTVARSDLIEPAEPCFKDLTKSEGATNTDTAQSQQQNHGLGREYGEGFGEVLEALVLTELGKASTTVSIKDLQSKILPKLPVAAVTIASALDKMYREGTVFRRLVTEGGTHYMYSTNALNVQNLAETPEGSTSIKRVINDSRALEHTMKRTR